MKSRFVNIDNARKGEYKKIIQQINSTNKCPFCRENFKYHKKPIIKKKDGWFLTENSWPYKNTSLHLIIIGEKHKEEFFELTRKDLEAVVYLTKWALKKFKIRGGGFAMRFGDSNFTGASVSHIHFHIISPELDKKAKRPRSVRFTIG